MSWLPGTEISEPMVTARSTHGAERTRADKIIELVAVILLGITTIGAAWCGYQASEWSGSSSELARQSSDQQVEAARLFGLATQTIAYDSTVTAQYAEAAAANNTRLQAFYRGSLMRREFLPTLDRWVADVRAGRTPTPLADDQSYLDVQLAPYRRAVAAASESSRSSQVASANASSYVQETILLAVALFFAGVTASFGFRPARALLLAAALATLALAGSQLAGLPVQF